MARANILYGGGDPVDYEELTATPADVPEGLTFLGHDSDGDPETGTLPDMENMYASPGYSSSKPNVPIHQAIYDGYTTDTNGDKKLAFRVPHGVYPDPEDESAYVGCEPSDIGIDANVIANGQTVGGVVGKYGSDGNLKASHLVGGEIGYGANGRVEGTAANRGSVTKTLAAGESYTINEGFFSNGKITAKDLESQTDGTATAADIITGLIAWVKGKKITGIMAKAADSKKTTLTSTDTRPVIQQTRQTSGDARVWAVKNADNTERLCILNPVAGFWAATDIIGVTLANVATALGLTAAKLKKGESVCGLTGTYTTVSSGQSAVTAAAMLKGYSGFANGGSEVKGSINSKAAATYNTSTADRTIAAAQYLSGDQTIKGVTTENIAAANIKKGVVVKVGDANSAGRIKNVTGTCKAHAHAYGTVTSGSSYKDAADYMYSCTITLPFIPVTGYIICYTSGQQRDCTLIDPNTGGGKQSKMVNFNQPKLHGYNSCGYAEGDSGFTCSGKTVILPCSYANQTYAYFFSGYEE